MAIIQRISPYAEDEKNLPVANIETAAPFYEKVMGFQIILHTEAPYKKVLLARDGLEIGLAENGGDPAQEGCFFEVDNVEEMFAELKVNGLKQATANYRIDQRGTKAYKVFFVIAPDGLCYCVGERQDETNAES